MIANTRLTREVPKRQASLDIECRVVVGRVLVALPSSRARHSRVNRPTWKPECDGILDNLVRALDELGDVIMEDRANARNDAGEGPLRAVRKVCEEGVHVINMISVQGEQETVRTKHRWRRRRCRSQVKASARGGRGQRKDDMSRLRSREDAHCFASSGLCLNGTTMMSED